MKRFFQVLISWWFATMVPVRAPLTTLAARENLRKRRLQSIILLLALIITLMMVVVYNFSMLVFLMLFCAAEACSHLAALWFNRRGYMELASPFLYDLMPAVLHHHEHWDGTGYPDQLVQEDIPLAARIIAVAEAYDAMVRECPYQTSRTPEEAMKELWRCAGTQFDPMVVQEFSTVLSEQSEQQDSQVAPALAP